MYQPSRFACNDLARAREAIAEYPLALLIGPERRPELQPGADAPLFGTHVPLTALDAGDTWLLEGHMARANPHWAWLSQQAEVMAVFSGPGAYVSPRHYERQQEVPTWNYVAVHVYGRIELIDDVLEKDHLLKRLIAQHEPGYAAQWRDLPADFQHKMLGAIVGFRLHIDRWEAKFKLSQNRSADERARIQSTQAAGSLQEQALSVWMSRLGL